MKTQDNTPQDLREALDNLKARFKEAASAETTSAQRALEINGFSNRIEQANESASHDPEASYNILARLRADFQDSAAWHEEMAGAYIINAIVNPDMVNEAPRLKEWQGALTEAIRLLPR